MGILPETGKEGAERLDRESVGWLTTITANGRPQSSVLWFVVHDGAIYVQSQPGAAKVTNIRSNHHVSFHLNSDAHGGEVVTVDAEAEILDSPPSDVLSSYLAKYERPMREQLAMTPDQLLADYGTTVRIIPRRVRTW
jgi:PPOX class probable F420-dependent enzyme